jgi:hypothetical protein
MLGPMLFALIDLVAAAHDPQHLRGKSPAVVISDKDNHRFGPFILFPWACTPQCIEFFGLHPVVHLRRAGLKFVDIEVQGFYTGKTCVLKADFPRFFPDGVFETHTNLILSQFLFDNPSWRLLIERQESASHNIFYLPLIAELRSIGQTETQDKQPV